MFSSKTQEITRLKNHLQSARISEPRLFVHFHRCINQSKDGGTSSRTESFRFWRRPKGTQALGMILRFIFIDCIILLITNEIFTILKEMQIM
jgi:hypothetical protein